MVEIFILPACSASPKIHYKNTIEDQIDFSELYKEKIISEELYKKILEVFPSGKARVWGNLPAKKRGKYLDKPQASYNQLKPGSIIFTYINWVGEREKRIDAIATCAFKIHDKKLAEELWQTNEDGKTWEYIFLLRDISFLDYPSEEFFKLIDYKKPPRGLQRVDKERVGKLLSEKVDFLTFIQEMKSFIPQDSNKKDKGKILKANLRDIKKSDKVKSETKKIIIEPDYIEQQQENKKTGDEGELKVIKKEKEYLEKRGRKDLSDKVEHTAKIDPNAGFDIKSYSESGEPKYIEVKSTQKAKRPIHPFFLTCKEKKIAEEKGNQFFLYIVFNARDDNYEIITIKNPISYINKSISIESYTFLCKVYLDNK